MAQTPPVLDYASSQRKRRWWRLPIVWEIICLNMWGTALLGVSFAAVGLASFIWPSFAVGLPSWIRWARSPWDRVLWIALNLTVAVPGLAFVRWQVRERTHRRGATSASRK